MDGVAIVYNIQSSRRNAIVFYQICAKEKIFCTYIQYILGTTAGWIGQP